MPDHIAPPAAVLSRRSFALATTAAGLAAALPRRAKAAEETIVGEGDYRFRVRHGFPQLPDRFTWQTTHGVAVDAAGNLYVIHEGHKDKKDHPAIFVFDQQGKFVRAFGSQFQGGGHGIEVRKEGNDEFLYVCGYQQVKSFAKLTLGGETVWFRKAPMESGVYAAGEDLSTTPNWSRQGFLPTNFAFLDDGGFLLADGYGSFKIHRFDKDVKWVDSFGGPGDGKGTFNTPHGLWIDRREGRAPTVVVTDRAHNTLQLFSLDGTYRETIPGFGLPANIDSWKNLLLVPELKACVTLLDDKNQVVARLGRAVERLDEIKNLRAQPDKWVEGQFVHPHDACFTPTGDIFVAEWVSTGRVSKLERIA
ncbi:MAG: hypothetical protein RLZZ111_2158 [Planctomycetota bacterium]|jgi:hypothetical protein